MNSLESTDLELAKEAHTLNHENDDIEVGLDASRIQISSESSLSGNIQENELSSSTTNTALELHPYMNFPFLI